MPAVVMCFQEKQFGNSALAVEYHWMFALKRQSRLLKSTLRSLSLSRKGYMVIVCPSCLVVVHFELQKPCPWRVWTEISSGESFEPFVVCREVVQVARHIAFDRPLKCAYCSKHCSNCAKESRSIWKSVLVYQRFFTGLAINFIGVCLSCFVTEESPFALRFDQERRCCYPQFLKIRMELYLWHHEQPGSIFLVSVTSRLFWSSQQFCWTCLRCIFSVDFLIWSSWVLLCCRSKNSCSSNLLS